MKRVGPSAGAILVGVLCVAGWPTGAAGFAEKPPYFHDPVTGQVANEEASSIHIDLTVALALGAGFSDDEARLAVWDQLVDSERLGPGTTVTYTNCLGAGKPCPDISACPSSAGAGEVVRPRTFDPTCATSRFGPCSPFFHFPHQTSDELGALQEWARGRATTLPGYAASPWGDAMDNALTADCRVTQSELIETGIAAGSHEAFGTYLHSLATATVTGIASPPWTPSSGEAAVARRRGRPASTAEDEQSRA